MEIASDEFITEAEKERSRETLSRFCEEACSNLSADEARLTAKAVYHDAVSAAAKEVATAISEEAIPIAQDIVKNMLRNPDQHSFVLESVLECAKPVAHHSALQAIRRWSEEKAIPKAEEAVRKVLNTEMSYGSQPVLQTAVFAGIRVLIENRLGSNQQLSMAEREKIIDDYMSGEAKKTALELVAKGITPEIRRKAQAAAEIAIAEVASQATDAIAREEALAASSNIATETAKQEISRLILAEAQRRAAKLARQRLQDEAQKIEEDKRLEYCQEEAKKIAEEAIISVTEEIADPSVADLDLEKARELALSAASAVAREFSGAYQLTQDDDCAAISKKTIAFLLAQVLLGCFIVWFFLLGGYELCQPYMKAILPPSIYQAIYKSVPAIPGNNNDATSTEIDDLLEDPEPLAPGTQSKDEPPTEAPPVPANNKIAPAGKTGA